MGGYAELQAISNFSFLDGASHPEELVLQAAALGYKAIAIGDINSVTGLVRAHIAAKEHGIQLIIAARLKLREGIDLIVYPTGHSAYGRLTSLLTIGKRRADKGDCDLRLADLASDDFAGGAGQMAAAVPPFGLTPQFERRLIDLRAIFETRLYLTVSCAYRGDDARRLHKLSEISAEPMFR
jgi:error-prone DNA polymerase